MAKPSLEVFIGADTKGFEKGLKSVEKQSAQFGKDIEQNTKETQAFSGAMSGVGGLIAGAFAVGSVVAFGKEVLNITGEFQKLEAVLTNTLGSKGAAQLALADIKEFAATTPYSVLESSQAFLKLANNGIRPTMVEMRAFADVAANAGKSIDMFAEATNDATRGEFERLKEFFISGKTEADKYVFTFKEQRYEVEKNATAVKDLLVQLGQLNGVAGATDAISKTLTGQVSALGDAWDAFILSVGSKSDGIMSSAITKLTKLVEIATYFNQQAGDLTAIKDDGSFFTAAERVKAEYDKLFNSLTKVQQAQKLLFSPTDEVNLDGKFDKVVVELWNQALTNVIKTQVEATEVSKQISDAYAKEQANVKALADAEAERVKGLELAAKVKRNNLAQQQITSSDNFSVSKIGAEFGDKDIEKSAAFNGDIPELGIDWEGEQAKADAYYASRYEGELKIAEGMGFVSMEMERQQEIALMLNEEFSSFFDQMFTDLAKGEFTWARFGRTLISTIGKIIAKLFAQAIAQAITAESSKGIIGVLTAGVAVAGLKGLWEANVPKFADGGIVSGQTLGVMGEYSGAKSNPEVIAPLDKLKGMMKNMGGSNMQVTGNFRVQGRDLVVVLENENRFTNRTN
jgi:hypothetical protein